MTGLPGEAILVQPRHVLCFLGKTRDLTPLAEAASAAIDRFAACFSVDDLFSQAAPDGHMESNVYACWRLKPGERAVIGSQCVWLARRTANVSFAEAFRAEAQRWYRVANLAVTNAVPEWLPGAIYYKTCAGGTIETRSSDVGGFDRFAHQLDYLADLGVNGILYHSVNTHQTLPDPLRGGWNQ